VDAKKAVESFEGIIYTPIKVLKLIKAENGVESNDDWMTEDQVKENMGI